MVKYQPPLQSRDPLLVRQVIEGEAQQHAVAVEMARKYSTFSEEVAIHAFAATISIDARRILNSPDLEPSDDWLPHDTPLDNLADLHHYARYSHLHPTLAFVGLVCLEWDLEGQRVKESLRARFSNGSEFNSVPDYVALAYAVSKEAALSEENRIALGAE